jgi:hypothetical protein
MQTSGCMVHWLQNVTWEVTILFEGEPLMTYPNGVEFSRK